MTPEVVICVPSKRHKSGPSAAAAATANGQAKEVEAEDSPFLGLSRIEQIRFQARRKAELEEEEREARKEYSSGSRVIRKSTTTVLMNDVDQERLEDDDSDDDFPDLASIKIPPFSHSSTSSLPHRSINSSNINHNSSQYGAPSSSISTSTGEVSSFISLPWSENYSNNSSANSSGTTIKRARRSTARVEPYVFRPSLDPISERRKKLQEVKNSAAVQARLVKTEDFKHNNRSDAIEKVLREHKREQRKGLDVIGLHNTIEMVRDINQMLDEEDRIQTFTDADEDQIQEKDSSSDSDLDTSSASSSSSSPPSSPHLDANEVEQVRFGRLANEEEIRKQKLSFVALTGDEEDDADGQEALNILLKDKENAKRRRRVGEVEDRGLKERSFWREGKRKREKAVFPDSISNIVIYTTLRDAFASDQHSMLTHILSSGGLTEQLENDCENTPQLIVWLFEVAILTPTSDLSFAAMQVVSDLLSHHIIGNMAAKAIIDCLPTLFLKLGARIEIITDCFHGANVEELDKANTSKANSSNGYVRRGERKRAIERLVHILTLIGRTLHQKASQDDAEDRLNFFIAILRLGVDPQLVGQEAQFERLLEVFLEAFLEGGPTMDSLIISRMTSILIGPLSPTAQRAILNIMPSTSLRTRALQRCLAHRILTSSIIKLDSATLTYSSLASVLSEKNAAFNPILSTHTRDYKQIEANIHILCYTFNDLALQLLHREDDKQNGSFAKSAFFKVIEQYFNCDTRGFLSQIRAKTITQSNCKISQIQVEALYRIMESLQILSNQIQDGKGAFLDRSKVKDQLQRLRLMLLYELSAFGLAGTKASSELQQSKLSKWLNS